MVKFDEFRKKMDPMYAAKQASGGQVANIPWPTNETAIPRPPEPDPYEEDIYS